MRLGTYRRVPPRVAARGSGRGDLDGHPLAEIDDGAGHQPDADPGLEVLGRETRLDDEGAVGGAEVGDHGGAVVGADAGPDLEVGGGDLLVRAGDGDQQRLLVVGGGGPRGARPTTTTRSTSTTSPLEKTRRATAAGVTAGAGRAMAGLGDGSGSGSGSALGFGRDRGRLGIGSGTGTGPASGIGSGSGTGSGSGSAPARGPAPARRVSASGSGVDGRRGRRPAGPTATRTSPEPNGVRRALAVGDPEAQPGHAGDVSARPRWCRRHRRP